MVNHRVSNFCMLLKLAIVAMDPNSRNDIVDNETLHKEVSLHVISYKKLDVLAFIFVVL